MKTKQEYLDECKAWLAVQKPNPEPYMKSNRSDKAMNLIEEEFCFSKADYLELAIKALEASRMIEESVSLEISRKSLQFALDWQREKEKTKGG